MILRYLLFLVAIGLGMSGFTLILTAVLAAGPISFLRLGVGLVLFLMGGGAFTLAMGSGARRGRG